METENSKGLFEEVHRVQKMSTEMAEGYIKEVMGHKGSVDLEHQNMVFNAFAHGFYHGYQHRKMEAKVEENLKPLRGETV